MANMKALGITSDDIERSVKFPVITEYVDYMRKCVDDYGLLGGITGLLQCSWVYAYIGEACAEKYPEEISKSAYGPWFEAYSCKSYLDTNQIWIDLLDRLGDGIDDRTADTIKKTSSGLGLMAIAAAAIFFFAKIKKR